LLQSEAQLEPKISRNLARRRYLQELKSWQNKVDQERLCVICQSTFDIGALTKCGHLFCFACLQIWLKNHHTCPVCKERLTNHDWHKIATQTADVVLRGTESSHHDHSLSEAIYDAIDNKILQQIQRVELKTSFGSKIDNLTRHLLWIQSQGGAKAVVFSQWSDVLDVMERSFKLNGIGYVRFDQKQRKDKDAVKLFKTSAEIQVFMLHSQSQSSGLSLIDATHCFLVEPLINSAIELQAVSRIHRLGQTKPTFVWLYTVNGTVEERVLELSSQKRLGNWKDWKDQLGNGKSAEPEPKPSLGPQLDESEARGLQQHVGRLLERRGIGEVVETGELWKCLFGDGERNSLREKALKEVQRDQLATAAEMRRGAMVRV
jgi:E3 ubiquitin-protein ligase SHPRH